MAASLSLATGVARQFDYWATMYRRTWKGSVVTSFVNPILYVVAMGVLLGGFIKADPARMEGAHSYLQFVVPGLLAAQSMQLAMGESMYPVMGMIRWHRTYFAMLATPLSVSHLVAGNLVFVAFRLLLSSVAFVAVMAPFGVVTSVAGSVLAVAIQLLLGMAFATPIYAFSCWTRDESGYTLIFRLLMMPLFLFSGAFFPLHNLSPVLYAIARWTPLWQGVDLTRMAALDTWSAGPALSHTAYLVVMATAGYVAAVRLLTRRLER